MIPLLETLRDLDRVRDRMIEMIEGEASRIDRDNRSKDPTDTERLIHRYSAARAVMIYRRRVGRDLNLSLEDCRNAFA